MQGKLRDTQEQVLKDSLSELVMTRPNQTAESLASDNKMLETVEHVVGAIQSKMGVIDDI